MYVYEKGMGVGIRLRLRLHCPPGRRPIAIAILRARPQALLKPSYYINPLKDGLRRGAFSTTTTTMLSYANSPTRTRVVGGRASGESRGYRYYCTVQ